jgi:hypothetical protein
MSNRELLEGLMKRVNALAGTHGEIFKGVRFGYHIVNFTHDCMQFDESVRSAGELIAYLHGVEDTLKFMKGK